MLHKAGIFVFFGCAFGFGLLSIKYILRAELDGPPRIAAALTAGAAVLSLAAYMAVLLSHLWPFLLQPASFGVALLAVIALLGGMVSSRFRSAALLSGLAIAAGFILLLLIRLAFIQHTLLPPYSDSPVHYQIVAGFLDPEGSVHSKLSLETLASNYYHFGFHSLAAWLATITGEDPARSMSLLGQLFLVLAPVSMFFLTYTLTGSFPGAGFASLLAAIGWDMPAFAINWGKFPAVAALSVLPAVIALLYLSLQGTATKKVGLLVTGILITGTVLLHTRSLVCVLLIVVCYWLSGVIPMERRPSFLKSIWYSVLYVVSLWPLLRLLDPFYIKPWVGIVLLLLLPFAFQSYPRLALSLLLFTCSIWLVAIVPTLLDQNAYTFLDRQFVEILFYIPLSLMGGAGLAGMVSRVPVTGGVRAAAMIVPVGIVLFGFLSNNSIHPDPCCNYFRETDRAAFQWIQGRTPKQALFLIAASQEKGQFLGTDAGIWLFPLLGQPTNKLPFNIDWESPEELALLCQLDAREIYIYAGGRNYSFDQSQLSRLDWASPAFTSGMTSIYQVTGCTK